MGVCTFPIRALDDFDFRWHQGFATSEMGFREQFAGTQSRAAHVRFGSKADISACLQHVRFTPKSGHSSTQLPCLLCAKSRHPRMIVLAANGRSISGSRSVRMRGSQAGTAIRVRRRRFLQIVTGILAIPVVSGNLRAQDYPTRPITIVVPGAPANPIDTLARFIVERTRASLGQPIIIENIVGASGSIGAGRVAHAAPDGYSLIIGTWGTHVVNGAVYALSYDVLNDFEPVALLTDNSQLIVGAKTLPANDLQGLMTWLKANPEKVFAGT